MEGIPILINSLPNKNVLIISPLYIFKNKTNVRLYFKVYNLTETIVESEQKVPLMFNGEVQWISIGYDDNENICYSAPIPIPSKKEFTIKTSFGSLFLFASFTETRATIKSTTIILNESKETIYVKPSSKVDPGSRIQLLTWRTKYPSASFGFSRNVGFTKPITLSTTELLKRKFVMNEIGQSLYYLTYSLQSTIKPYLIIFHHDPSPPLIIINESLINYQIYFNKKTISITPKNKIFLPKIPEILKIGNIGNDPFTISLLYPIESIIRQNNTELYVRVEKRANQVIVTFSQTYLSPIPKYPQIKLSFFISTFKIYFFNDFINPGIPIHSYTITISPLASNIIIIPNTQIEINFSLDTLQIDNIQNYQKFPVIIRKSTDLPLVQLTAKFMNQFNEGFIIDNMNFNLQPLHISIEENLVRFVLQLITLLTPTTNKIEIENDINDDKIQNKLIPLYIKNLLFNETKIILSLATQSIINADFQKIPIFLSQYLINDIELFQTKLFQQLIFHYVSDVLAAIPSVIASLSLIGNPANIVNKSIAGVKEFYNQAFLMSDSLLFGIGKGSMNLLKGVTTGALEGFVGFTNTLEKSLSKFKFFDEEPNQRVIDELAHAISGMVTLPVREFHQQGVPGIFKGAGKGILGLVTVPATAFFSILKKTGVILLDKVGDEKIEEDLRLEKEAKELPTFTIE